MAKILVVDDEEHIRMLYEEELKEEGYEVATAATGRNIEDLIEREKPNLILLDIKMADCDGLDVLQRIRNKYPDLPVILSTAYETYKSDIKSMAADAYVVKSFDLTELKRKIKQCLEAKTISE
ncbi:MAG TPA: response regulator [Candidatus Desulfofervidus auxilii]|uniref:Response regulator n=1 Tax=Desulfofervidus auxilii TaxID=1621989 RepID=A0A7V0IA24_DESA2|nr:response regulator [Candidatus Desulfofervidus auxilii]